MRAYIILFFLMSTLSAYAQPDTAKVARDTAVVTNITLADTLKTSDTAKIAKERKDFGVVAIPTVSFNRSHGIGFGALGMMFFKTGDKTPPSRLIVKGDYTTEKDWAAMSFLQLFLAEDFLRLSVGGGYFDSHFQTFASVEDYGSVEVPYNNKGYFIMASPLFRVYKKLYVGPTFRLFNTNVTFDLPDGTTSTQENNSNSLGVITMFDSKDNQYNPSKGLVAHASYTANPEWFGNDSVFNKLFLFVNNYIPVRSNMVLASRLSGNVGLGHVPFSSQSYVGGNDIRGYTKGEYRGNQTYALQSELRWTVYKRFGVVGFFGMAMTVDPSSQILPGGGAGIRYMILKKYKINAGLDGAIGKNDWGLYFRITEAF